MPTCASDCRVPVTVASARIFKNHKNVARRRYRSGVRVGDNNNGDDCGAGVIQDIDQGDVICAVDLFRQCLF